jgi:hypothetical protein
MMADVNQAWSMLGKLSNYWPEQNVFEHALYLNVCPQGLIDDELIEFIELEAMCETYKTSPTGGALDEWPARTTDAFLTIRRTHNQVRKENAKRIASKGGK